MINLIKRICGLYYKHSNPTKYALKAGVKMGQNCRFVGNNDFGSEPYLISIGDHVSITSSRFITHDGGIWVFREEYPDLDIIKSIEIGNNVFIGANVTVLPGVKIGDNIVVGACSLVTKNLESNYVYGGIPARKIKTLKDYKSSILDSAIKTKLMDPKAKKEYLMKHFVERT